jgi:hypothetical protein
VLERLARPGDDLLRGASRPAEGVHLRPPVVAPAHHRHDRVPAGQRHVGHAGVWEEPPRRLAVNADLTRGRNGPRNHAGRAHQGARAAVSGRRRAGPLGQAGVPHERAHPLLVGHVGLGQRHRVGQRGPARHHRDPARVQHRVEPQAVGRADVVGHRHVHRAGAHGVVLGVPVEVDVAQRQPRVLDGHQLAHPRPPVGQPEPEHADPQHRGLGRRARRGELGQLVDLGQYPLRPHHEALPGRGQRDPAAGPVEQARAEVTFQALHVASERLRGEVVPARRPAEVQLLGQGHDVPQRLEVH